jgi:hypothetical protein
MWWGLVPLWAKDMSGAAMMINARSETAATKPAFRDPLANRRCPIPADGFYEWQRAGKAKSRIALKSTTGRCSHSRGYGIAGKTRAASGSSRARICLRRVQKSLQECSASPYDAPFPRRLSVGLDPATLLPFGSATPRRNRRCSRRRRNSSDCL